jgi:hypothetical protein
MIGEYGSTYSDTLSDLLSHQEDIRLLTTCRSLGKSLHDKAAWLCRRDRAAMMTCQTQSNHTATRSNSSSSSYLQCTRPVQRSSYADALPVSIRAYVDNPGLQFGMVESMRFSD